MTVAVPCGTAEVTVPRFLRNQPALDGDQIGKSQHLAELTERIPLTGRETSQRNSSESRDVCGRARTDTFELQGRYGRIDTASWILDAHSTPAQAQAARRSHPFGVAA